MIAIVLKDYNAAFLRHCWFLFFLWCGCWYANKKGLLFSISGQKRKERFVYLKKVMGFFSSRELKSQVSSSDHLSSICPSVCLSVCLSICLSSRKPLSLFQPNLAQSILGWSRFNFVQMKCQALFHPNFHANFNLGKKHPCVKRLKFFPV